MDYCVAIPREAFTPKIVYAPHRSDGVGHALRDTYDAPWELPADMSDLLHALDHVKGVSVPG